MNKLHKPTAWGLLRELLVTKNMSDTRAAQVLGINVRDLREMKNGDRPVALRAFHTLSNQPKSDGAETGCRVLFPLDWPSYRCADWLMERGMTDAANHLTIAGNKFKAEFQP